MAKRRKARTVTATLPMETMEKLAAELHPLHAVLIEEGRVLSPKCRLWRRKDRTWTVRLVYVDPNERGLVYPITLDEVRQRAPMLFGPEPDDDVLDACEVDPVHAAEAPPHDPQSQQVVEGEPEMVDGAWRQTWVVADLPPPPVPADIGPLQFRRAVRQFGMKATFDAFVAQLDEEDAETIEYATSIRRDDPLIEKARVELGWTVAQVDQLFRVGATL